MSTSQSQVSSQALDPEWKTFPLEKFSFAVSPLGAGSHQWVHETRRNELFLVFRPIRIPCGGDRYESRLVMSVSIGSEVLEHQDVLRLARVAENFENLVQQGLANPTLEAPVHVVIKYPCIAVRYPASPNTVRRVQMRFKSEADYQGAVDIFKQLRLPIRDAASKSSSAAPARPSRPASASMIQNSSHTASNRFPLHPNMAPSYQVPMPSRLETSPFPNPRLYSIGGSPLFGRSLTDGSEVTRPTSAWSLDSGRLSNTTSLTSLTSFGQPEAKPNSAPEPHWPASSILIPQHEKEPDMSGDSVAAVNANSTMASATSQKLNKISVAPIAGTMSEVFGLANHRISHSQSDTHKYHDDMGQVKRATSAYEAGIARRHGPGKPLDSSLSLLVESSRPVSAPIPGIYDISGHSVPPRRELPFPKPRRSAKSHDPTNELPIGTQPQQSEEYSRGNEVIQYLTPAASTTSTGCAAEIVTHNKRTTHENAHEASPRSPINQTENDEKLHKMGHMAIEHVEEMSPLAGISTTISRPSTAPGFQSKETTIISRKRPSEAPIERARLCKYAGKMVDRGTQTKTLSGRDHTAPLSLKSNNNMPIPAAIVEDPVSSPQIYMNDLDIFISKHKNRPPPQELWQRPGYDEIPPEERQAIINDFICENLDNDEFIQLCEDTASVWRRIGLGM